MKKLEEEFAAKNTEIAALKDSMQKAADELTGLRATLASKDGEIKALNDAKLDMRGQLGGLESALERANLKSRTLTADLEKTRGLQKVAEQKLAQEEKSIADWTASLVGIAQRVGTQMTAMGLQALDLSMNTSQPRTANLPLFLEGLLTELETYHADRAKTFANEAKILVRNVILRMFTKVMYYNPGADLQHVFKKVPESAELEVARQAAIPIADKVAEKCSRIETLRQG